MKAFREALKRIFDAFAMQSASDHLSSTRKLVLLDQMKSHSKTATANK